jgi:hypothetical protein
MLEITRAKSNLFENACWKFHKECNQAKTYKFIKISSTYKFLYMSPLPLTVSRLYLTFLTEDYLSPLPLTVSRLYLTFLTEDYLSPLPLTVSRLYLTFLTEDYLFPLPLTVSRLYLTFLTEDYLSPLPLTVSRLYLTFLTEDYPGNPLHYLRAKSVSFATSAVALLPLPLLYGVIIIMISYWTTFYHDIDFVWFIHTRCIF